MVHPLRKGIFYPSSPVPADTRHDSGNKVVQATKRWTVQFKGPRADVVQGLYPVNCFHVIALDPLATRLVVNSEGLIGDLKKLVDGKGGILGL